MTHPEINRAGQVCRTCYPMWAHQGLAPKYYLPVYDSQGQPSHTETGIPIVACPYCDGELIFTLPKKSATDD